MSVRLRALDCRVPEFCQFVIQLTWEWETEEEEVRSIIILAQRFCEAVTHVQELDLKDVVQIVEEITYYSNWSFIFPENGISEQETLHLSGLGPAAKLYGIPKATIVDRITGKRTIVAKRGSKPDIPHEVEKQMVEVVLESLISPWPKTFFKSGCQAREERKTWNPF